VIIRPVSLRLPLRDFDASDTVADLERFIQACDKGGISSSKLGEICASYCLKGRRVYIEGRLRTREYDGGDGLRRHTTEIVAETMKLLDRPRAENEPAHAEETAADPEAAAVAAAVA
jgi:hypothetical protein